MTRANRYALRGLVCCLLVIAAGLQTAPAQAAFPGLVNGPILGLQGTELATLSPDGDGPIPVPGIAGPVDSAAYSWKSSAIAFASGGNIGRKANFSYFASPGLSTVTSAGTDGWPAWSPDGSHIAFVRDLPNGATQVHAVKKNGTGVVRLTNDGPNPFEVARAPRWSPDAQSVAYLGNREAADSTDLFLIRLEAGASGRVYRILEGVDQFDWAPSGEAIAVSVHGNSRGNPLGGWSSIGILDLYTGYLQIVVDNSWPFGSSGDKTTFASHPVWSPDGRWIVYRSQRVSADQAHLPQLRRYDVLNGLDEPFGPRELDFTPLWWGQNCGGGTLFDAPRLSLPDTTVDGQPVGWHGSAEVGPDGASAESMPAPPVQLSRVPGNLAAGAVNPPEVSGVRVEIPWREVEQTASHLAKEVGHSAEQVGIAVEPEPCQPPPATPALWPPPIVTTVSASVDGLGKATLTGHVNTAGSQARTFFELGATPDFGQRTITTLVDGIKPLTAQVTGLMPETLYYYRAVAVSRGGVAYGATRTFFVPVPPPSADVVAELYIHGIDAIGKSGDETTCSMWNDFKAGLNTGVTKYSVAYYHGDAGCDLRVDGHGSHERHFSQPPLSIMETWFEHSALPGSPGNSHHVSTSIEHLGQHFAWMIYDRFTSKGQTVSVVAHSMGGLITRYALAQTERGHPDFPPRLYVKNVVTLGTPHGGSTSLATTGCAFVNGGFLPRQCAQMTAPSAFLSNLAADTAGRQARRASKTSLETDWSLISSEDDSMVNEESGVDMEAQHRYIYRAQLLKSGVAHSGDNAFYKDTGSEKDRKVDRSDHYKDFQGWMVTEETSLLGFKTPKYVAPRTMAVTKMALLSASD